MCFGDSPAVSATCLVCVRERDFLGACLGCVSQGWGLPCGSLLPAPLCLSIDPARVSRAQPSLSPAGTPLLPVLPSPLHSLRLNGEVQRSGPRGLGGQADHLCLVELPPTPFPRVRDPVLFPVLQRHLVDSVSEEGVAEPEMGTN